MQQVCDLPVICANRYKKRRLVGKIPSISKAVVIDIKRTWSIVKIKSEKRNDTERLRRENRSAILLALRNRGPMARVELGSVTGLSPAAITAITKDLMNEGLLLEIAAADQSRTDSRRGRPRVLLDINGEAGAVIGVTVSAGQIEISLASFRGDLVSSVSISQPLETYDAETFNQQLAKAIEDFLEQKEIPRKHLLSIGISMQGMVDSGQGKLIWSPILQLQNHNVVESLQKAFDCPAELLNDANAIALALRAKPENQQLEQFVCVMLGVGVGAGIFVNGGLYQGFHGAAGEFGHIKYRVDGEACRCGQSGCIEAYISDYALCRDFMASRNLPASELAHPSEHILAELGQAAREGDKALVEWFNRAGAALGFGVSQVIQMLSPQKIIVSGSGVRSFDLMESAMRETLEKLVVAPVLNRVEITSESFQEDLVALGTVKRALARFYYP